MAVLTNEEQATALAGLTGWQVIDGELRKKFTCANFVDALELVNRVGELAEAVGHHPDITINYNRVTFSLVTHDEDGITVRDVELATQIEAAAR